MLTRLRDQRRLRRNIFFREDSEDVVGPLRVIAADVIIKPSMAEVHVMVSPQRGVQLSQELDVCNVHLSAIWLIRGEHFVEDLIRCDCLHKVEHGLIVGVSWHVEVP